VWPPVADADPAGRPDEPENLWGDPSRPDLTAEIPRVRVDYDPEPRSGAAPEQRPSSDIVPAPPARYADDLTMELPIFRELESAWFRVASYEPAEAPVSPVSTGPTAGPDPRGPMAPLHTPPAAPGPREPLPRRDEAEDREPVGTAPRAGNGRSAPAGPSVAGGNGTSWSDRTGEYSSVGAPGAPGEPGWRTVADTGWDAAQAAAAPVDGGNTETGLPRRVPMAQLVPGGVETVAASAQRRSPDAVRGLLSAYHRGVQRGRTSSGKSDPNGTQSPQGGKEQEA
jgi:hypothetical protein